MHIVEPEPPFYAQAAVIGRGVKGGLYAYDAIIFDVQGYLATYPTVRAGRTHNPLSFHEFLHETLDG